jgi:TRAP-type C4-dicarboxylate transport system permease small subunit
MKLFLSALCLCASGLLIYVSYTMIDQFHDASLKWIEALKEKDEDLENIQAILSQYEKPIDFMYKVFHKIHSFVK